MRKALCVISVISFNQRAHFINRNAFICGVCVHLTFISKKTLTLFLLLANSKNLSCQLALIKPIDFFFIVNSRRIALPLDLANLKRAGPRVLRLLLDGVAHGRAMRADFLVAHAARLAGELQIVGVALRRDFLRRDVCGLVHVILEVQRELLGPEGIARLRASKIGGERGLFHLRAREALDVLQRLFDWRACDMLTI